MVLISDLVARVRAEGVDQTATAVKQVTASAQEAARALQLMAEAASKSGTFAGTPAAQILEMFQKGSVQPTAAALSQARAEMEKTAAAAAQAVPHTQNLAKAAVDHAEGWKLSESSMVRFGTALIGVNLGISLVAGAARQIHEQIVGAVDAARELDVASRAAAGSYGPAAGRALSSGAAAFAADPSTRGSAAQYVEAVSGLRGLTSEYGLNLAQVQQLVLASGQLARVQGVELPTAAKALGEVMSGNVRAAESLGVVLADQQGRIRGVGASYDELVTISGRTRAEQVLLQTTLHEVQTQQDNTRNSSNDLAVAFDRLGKAARDAQQWAANMVSGPATAVANTGATILEGRGSTSFIDPSGGFATGATANRLAQAQAARIEGARAAQLAIQSERADLIQSTQAVQQNTAAVQAQATAYENARLAINRTVESLGRVRQEQGQYATIAEAARGPMFPQVLGAPLALGAAQAAEDVLATRQQRIAQGQAGQMRGQLQQAVTTAGDIGPNATARAQQELDQYDRRVAARVQQAQAQHDLAINDLNLAQNQAGLTDISLRQRERELDMQRQTIGLRREDLQLQVNVLQATQGVTQARMGALPVQNAASAFTYQQNMAQALAQQRMARLLQGQDVSGLPTIDQLIQMNAQGQLGAAENAPALVQANRGIEVASQAQTAAQLLEQTKATQLQATQIALDTANLSDLPAMLDLQSQGNQLQRDQLLAQQEERDAVLRLIQIAEEPPKAGAGVGTGITPISITINGADAQRIKDEAHQAVEDALNIFFGAASSDAPPAPRELAGARRGPH